VQNEWKQKLVSGAGQRARVAATVAFTTQAEWLQVKSALAQASQTLVSDIQIEALAKDGAVLSFSHTGSDAQLAAELNRYGVQYAASANGATLRAGRL
jgi:secreted protein with Ig-like and vWFA domain